MSDPLSMIPKIIFSVWDVLMKKNQSKQSQDPIEQANFTKHFFDHIEGQAAHPMVLDRNLQALLSNNKINDDVNQSKKTSASQTLNVVVKIPNSALIEGLASAFLKMCSRWQNQRSIVAS